MAAAHGISPAIPRFKKPKDPQDLIRVFDEYVKQVELMFMVFEITPDKKDKMKGMIQLWGGKDMQDLFDATTIPATATFEQAITAIRTGMQGRVNDSYPMYRFFTNMPQGSKPITDYMQEVLEAAKRLPLAKNCECLRSNQRNV